MCNITRVEFPIRVFMWCRLYTCIAGNQYDYLVKLQQRQSVSYP